MQVALRHNLKMKHYFGFMILSSFGLLISTYSVCLHYSCFRKAAILNSPAYPAVEALIAIHPPAVHWSLLFDTLYHMMEDMHTNGLKIHTNNYNHGHMLKDLKL